MGSQTAVLTAAKYSGAFRVARRLTRRGLRIVCFHGLSLADEHRWSPGLFMTEARFIERLTIIQRMGLPVVPLQDVASGEYPDGAVVITFDDGWTGTRRAAEILHRFGFPSTLYAHTEYIESGYQVYNVMIPYLMWKSGRRECDAAALQLRARALDPARRQAFIDHLVRDLGVHDVSHLFRYMTPSDAARLPALGMRLELHTHRHEWRPADADWNAAELRDNATAIERLTRQRPRHLCYPSGVFTEAQFPVLADAGVVTATTCERGLNFASTHPWLMHRFLDSEVIPAIKFEAELAGLLDLLRAPSRLLRDSRRAFRADHPLSTQPPSSNFRPPASRIPAP